MMAQEGGGCWVFLAALRGRRRRPNGDDKLTDQGDEALVFYECEDKAADDEADLDIEDEAGPSRWPWCCSCRCRKRRQGDTRTRRRVLSDHLAAVDENGASSSSLDNLSPSKRKMVRDMRFLIEALPAAEGPPRRHDLWLKRFLAHGKWNLEKGMQKYMEMETWRKDVGADRMMVDPDLKEGRSLRSLPVDLIGFYPFSRDKIGRSIAWMRIGHVPWWRSLIEIQDDSLQSSLWMQEKYMSDVAQRAKEEGKWFERAVVLIDLGQLDFTYFRGLASSSRARDRAAKNSVAQYYPGIVDKAYIINAPGFVNRAWSMVKMFLSKELMEKATLVATDAEKAQMLVDLGAENVPTGLGGKAAMPVNDTLPEHLRMPAAGWSSILDAWRPKESTIAKYGKKEEVVPVPAGGRVRWRWALAEAGVFFEIATRRSKGEFETVEERQEFTFHGVEDPQHGEILAPEGGGEIRFTWDNSANYWTKTLLYRFEILT